MSGRKVFIESKFKEKNTNSRIKKLKKFLLENKEYPQRFRINYLRLNYDNNLSAKEKLRKLFINSINAGGRNLTLKGESAGKFAKLIVKLNHNKRIDAYEFFSLFSPKIKNLEQLNVDWGLKKRFPDLGRKKIALFIRDIHLIQTYFTKSKIFKNLVLNKSDLLIPVDIVICNILNIYFKLKRPNELKGSSDFELVNDIAISQFGSDYMLLEDLWYWGHFTLDKNRNINLNYAKFYTDLFLEPTKDNENKFKKFICIISS